MNNEMDDGSAVHEPDSYAVSKCPSLVNGVHLWKCIYCDASPLGGAGNARAAALSVCATIGAIRVGGGYVETVGGTAGGLDYSPPPALEPPPLAAHHSAQLGILITRCNELQTRIAALEADNADLATLLAAERERVVSLLAANKQLAGQLVAAPDVPRETTAFPANALKHSR